jgi:hypothetical protein
MGKQNDNPKARWHIPAAWKGGVIEAKVKLWQVFADTKIPHESMNY